MHGWTIALIAVWALLLVTIFLAFACAIHRHTRRPGPLYDPFPLSTPHDYFREPVPHNSVLLYPPSARSVGLSPEQVAHAAPLRTTPFEETTCTICLDDMAPPQRVRHIRLCSHIFHSACIQSWLSRNNSCPNCQRIALNEPGVELEIESVSSKDWRSFGYGQWVGQVGQNNDRTSVV